MDPQIGKALLDFAFKAAKNRKVQRAAAVAASAAASKVLKRADVNADPGSNIWYGDYPN
ncbi:hypothetical protein QLQ12_14560 [Actinoplanes sp. NEAU-A12]|uniref:Uncharacterized protein n=1 Tax=Actinoplanes sandaracinus TaxID=3045177 RepID=A0ABT6WJC3_9ACTN|nr:hypothetical protein [Actinoplanes sandaracinus]MDI6099821.1 hypothetical protein [Actinoplanes sandaracinus]